MTVEYRNGVQSSTISYSNMVIPEGITDNIVYMYLYIDAHAQVFFRYMTP